MSEKANLVKSGLETAYLNSNDSAGTLDLQTQLFLTKNPQLTALLAQWDGESLPFSELLGSTKKSEIEKFFNDIRSDNSGLLYGRISAPDNAPMDVLVRAHRIDSNSALIQIIDISADVQRKEEESQKKWIHYFEHFFANTKDIVNLFSLTQRKILRWNTQAGETLGFDKGDLENLPIEDIYPPAELMKLGAAFERLAEKGFVEEKLKCYNKQRDLQDIWIRAFVIQYEPEVLCLVHTIDITKEKEREQQLLKETRLSALGEASATLAHEINNSLQSIQFDLYFLGELEEVMSDDINKRIKTIEHNTLHIGSVVRNIQNYAHFSPADGVNTLVGTLVEGVALILDGYLKSHKIKLEINVPKNLSPVCVDPNQVQQILLILVKNAAQAMAHSEQKFLYISAIKSGSGLDLVVKDTGPGIPESVRARLFDAFVTTKTSGTGLGLGLSVAKKLAAANNITMSFTTEEGVGAEFTLSFPVTELHPSKPSEILLYVDDRDTLLPSITNELVNQGITIISARACDEAMSILRQSSVRMVVCAENMYPISGLAFIKEARTVFSGPICVTHDAAKLPDGVTNYAELSVDFIAYPCEHAIFCEKVSALLADIPKENT